MRSYSVLLPAFWSGTTGKAITIAGKDTRILATYLLTCEHANMLGLYRLPLLYIAEETGLKRKEVTAAFENLKAIGFAYYDEGAGFVWVVEMARFQLGLLPGEPVKEGDKRRYAVAKLYKQLPTNPFLGPFYDRYAGVLTLPLRRDFLLEAKPHTNPFNGASMPHARDYDPVPDPDPVRKGETGETKLPPEKVPTVGDVTPEQLQSRWNAIPGVKACKVLGPTIRDRVRSRLTEHPDTAWWDELFKLVQTSDFLCGRTNGKEGPFRASLDWILGPKILDRIFAGNYDSTTSNGHALAKTCAKRIQKDQFLKPCGAPADPRSGMNEPRCFEHLTPASHAQGVVTC